MPAARRIAHGYRSPRHQEDLEQVAYLGLAKAAERFEPARGVQFLSYATPTIHGEIKRYLRDHGWDVHVPRQLQEQALRVRQTSAALVAELGRPPTTGEIAERLDETADNVRAALRVMTARSAHSLEALSENTGSGPAVLPRALRTEAADSDGFDRILDRAALRSALETLSDDERYTIGLRYLEELTQEEIATRTGVSKMTVSRRLHRALQRARENGHTRRPSRRERRPHSGRAEGSLIVPVLDRDPDLGAALPPREFERARRLAVAEAVTLPTGPWSAKDRGEDGLGLLLVGGLLVRKATVQGQTCAEILGPGDIVQPRLLVDPGCTIAMEIDWEVLDVLHLAVLDGRFASRVARWPAIAGAVAERAAMRAHRLSFQLSICRMRRVDERVLLLLWQLASRWGHVTTRGVELRLPVTHGLLAMMVGARRPPVTMAIRLLTEAGLIERPGPAKWLLVGSPPIELGHGDGRSSGDALSTGSGAAPETLRADRRLAG